MSILSKEKGLYNSEVELIYRLEESSVYRMINDDGDGIMTSYQGYSGQFNRNPVHGNYETVLHLFLIPPHYLNNSYT